MTVPIVIGFDLDTIGKIILQIVKCWINIIEDYYVEE